ncbi:uncharacterized protein LOC131023098 [Salvia miltiorrhiza]|uniref:uncharacterized protein LOC131023098 n=1 Tax=Salvia miltiorrhiza TaxID=226208 RepID=UPI0025AD7C1D|nr:uncharacterized protein LOC131023098 [Salvia miltiorrhiza]
MPPCAKCNKMHLRVCKAGSNVCYNCGQAGHYSSHCPSKQQGMARGKPDQSSAQPLRAIMGYQATIGMAPYEALYGKKCRSPLYWDEVGERKVLGPDTVAEMIEIVRKIRQRIKEAQDRQKSYADTRRTELHFEIGDKVFFKVSPSKGINRFGVKGKLRPRFIDPYEILEKIGPVACRLALPPSFGNVHNVFHVSQLRRYVFDPKHVVYQEEMVLEPDLSYEESPEIILDRKIQQLRSKSIALVKVQWRHHGYEEATWELEDKMREKYPELFQEM